ncbi:MAG: cohesin domain-containing protein [Patescibacteria group bacterium]
MNFQPVFGAEIFVEWPKEIGVNQQFQADIFIDTKGENVNAVEGELDFQRGFLGIKEISDGNSIVNFWIQRPKLTLDNKIIFAGIIPTGYSGKGKIFSVVFQSLKQGDTSIDFGNLKILLNDGSGTPVQTSSTRARVKISNIKVSEEILRAKPADSESPESFQIYLSNDKNVFDGKWFIVFATQDKNSGIDRYEVSERKQGFLNFFRGLKWTGAESPYLLDDQGLSSDVYVRAFDRAGNYRTEHLTPANSLSWYENWLVWAIIIIILAAFYWKTKKHYVKKRRK